MTWEEGVTRVGLLYGVHGWKEWGPKLKRSKGFKGELSDPPPAILEAWNDLVVYIKSNGVKHLYYADIAIDKASAKVREGEGIQLRYDR